MKTGTFTVNNEEETQKLAQELAHSLNTDDLLLLSGPLGAGKSVFARAIINTLSDHQNDIPSPTFTLIQQYETSKGLLHHFDLYRIENPEEIYELGWEDTAGQQLAVVEWPEKLGFLRPTDYIEVIIQPLDGTRRSVTITDQRKTK